jgi:hypothetical protein
MDEKQLLYIYPEIEMILKHPIFVRLKKIRLTVPAKYSCYDSAIGAARMSYFIISVLKYRHTQLYITEDEVKIVTLSALFYFSGTPPFGPFSNECCMEDVLSQSVKNASDILSTEYPEYMDWIKYIINPYQFICPNPERLFVASIVNGFDDTLGSIGLDYTWRRGSLLENGNFIGFDPVDLMCGVILSNNNLICMDSVSKQFASFKLLKRYLENQKIPQSPKLDITTIPYYHLHDDVSIMELLE